MSDPPSPKRWMYFSDEQVRAVPEEDVLKSQAYMLFYERSVAQPKWVHSCTVQYSTVQYSVVRLEEYRSKNHSAAVNQPNHMQSS